MVWSKGKSSSVWETGVDVVIGRRVVRGGPAVKVRESWVDILGGAFLSEEWAV